MLEGAPRAIGVNGLGPSSVVLRVVTHARQPLITSRGKPRREAFHRSRGGHYGVVAAVRAAGVDLRGGASTAAGPPRRFALGATGGHAGGSGQGDRGGSRAGDVGSDEDAWVARAT